MSRYSEFERASRERDQEMDGLAAYYVRQGYSPWEAMVKASESIRMGRRFGAPVRTVDDVTRKDSTP